MARRMIVILGLAAVLIAAVASAAAATTEYRPGDFSAPAASASDPDEAAGLVFVREEERLARDVYRALAEIWDAPIFERIAASEQRHMDAVLRLLEARNLADPSAGLAPGEYRDPGLQALHDDLLARGTESVSAALEVGVLIEQVDIADLERRLEQAASPDVVGVYENLLEGSERHLAAFSGDPGGRCGRRR